MRFSKDFLVLFIYTKMKNIFREPLAKEYQRSTEACFQDLVISDRFPKIFGLKSICLTLWNNEANFKFSNMGG